VPAARLLVERLVVVDADAVHAHQLGGDPGEPARERELRGPLVHLEQVADLDERLAVGVALGERLGVLVVRHRHLAEDGPIGRDFSGVGDAAEQRIALLAVVGDLLGGEGVIP
jgi:hypothetical protein